LAKIKQNKPQQKKAKPIPHPKGRKKKKTTSKPFHPSTRLSYSKGYCDCKPALNRQKQRLVTIAWEPNAESQNPDPLRVNMYFLVFLKVT
jgi:hypothetical protein